MIQSCGSSAPPVAVEERRVARPEQAVVLKASLRALRRLKREQEPQSQWIFATERGGPFTTAGFNRMVERAGEAAGLGELKPHAHMLRHSAGYKLANDGRDTRLIQDYLGHKSIASTARYTALAAGRFKGLF